MIGLVAVIALLLFVVGGIYLVTKARKVRIRVTIQENSGVSQLTCNALLTITCGLIIMTIEFLKKQPYSICLNSKRKTMVFGSYTAQTSPKPNLPREMTATSANLSHEEFTGI